MDESSSDWPVRRAQARGPPEWRRLPTGSPRHLPGRNPADDHGRVMTRRWSSRRMDSVFPGGLQKNIHPVPAGGESRNHRRKAEACTPGSPGSITQVPHKLTGLENTSSMVVFQATSLALVKQMLAEDTSASPRAARPVSGKRRLGPRMPTRKGPRQAIGRPRHAALPVVQWLLRCLRWYRCPPVNRAA